MKNNGTIYNFEYTPVFKVGDIVHYVRTKNVEKFLDCPDCLGAGEWTTTSPAGIDYSFSCPRCSNRHHHDKHRLGYYEITYSIKKLTIGSIRIDTNDKKNPITYMCAESGVGSGSIYNEKDFHGTKGAAELYAEQLVAKANRDDPSKLENYKERLSLSRHHLHLIPKNKDEDGNHTD